MVLYKLNKIQRTFGAKNRMKFIHVCAISKTNVTDKH